jgi:WD40 repeat protein
VAVVEHHNAALIISAGHDGALRSWQLDGSRGKLNVPNAHSASIRALAVVEHQKAVLIISAGHDGALRSWRLDGGRGELDVPDAHSDSIRAVAVVEHQAPLIVSAGDDRAIVASQIAAARQAASPRPRIRGGAARWRG